MRYILYFALLVILVSTARAADVDNPFKTAKVGDWVEYKMTDESSTGKLNQTIVAKNDKEATYEVSYELSSNGGKPVGPMRKKMTVDLTKDYVPLYLANLKADKAKIEKIGEGAETLTVGGKEIDTKWTEFKATPPDNNNPLFVTDYKTWTSSDIPIEGQVKQEVTMPGSKVTWELVASGYK